MFQKWEKFKVIRKVVNAAIEVERANKIIGSSLEASAIINFKDKNVLNIIKSVDFRENCITSDLETNFREELKVNEVLSQDSLALVEIIKAKGEKCNRCWKYSQNCSETYGKLLCPRCTHVLEGQRS